MSIILNHPILLENPMIRVARRVRAGWMSRNELCITLQESAPADECGSRRRPTRFGFWRNMQTHLQANWIRTLTGLEGLCERVKEASDCRSRTRDLARAPDPGPLRHTLRPKPLL
jgi:hypothetical protein